MWGWGCVAWAQKLCELLNGDYGEYVSVPGMTNCHLLQRERGPIELIYPQMACFLPHHTEGSALVSAADRSRIQQQEWVRQPRRERVCHDRSFMLCQHEGPQAWGWLMPAVLLVVQGLLCHGSSLLGTDVGHCAYSLGSLHTLPSQISLPLIFSSLWILPPPARPFTTSQESMFILTSGHFSLHSKWVTGVSLAAMPTGNTSPAAVFRVTRNLHLRM